MSFDWGRYAPSSTAASEAMQSSSDQQETGSQSPPSVSNVITDPHLDLDLEGKKHIDKKDDGVYATTEETLEKVVHFEWPGQKNVDAMRAYLKLRIPRSAYFDQYGNMCRVEDMPSMHLPQFQALLWRDIPREQSVAHDVTFSDVSAEQVIDADTIVLIANALQQGKIFVFRNRDGPICSFPLCKRMHDDLELVYEPYGITIEPLLDWTTLEEPALGPEKVDKDIITYRRKQMVYAEHGVNVDAMTAQDNPSFCGDCLKYLWTTRQKSWAIMERFPILCELRRRKLNKMSGGEDAKTDADMAKEELLAHDTVIPGVNDDDDENGNETGNKNDREDHGPLTSGQDNDGDVNMMDSENTGSYEGPAVQNERVLPTMPVRLDDYIGEFMVMDNVLTSLKSLQLDGSCDKADTRLTIYEDSLIDKNEPQPESSKPAIRPLSDISFAPVRGWTAINHTPQHATPVTEHLSHDQPVTTDDSHDEAINQGGQELKRNFDVLGDFSPEKPRKAPRTAEDANDPVDGVKKAIDDRRLFGREIQGNIPLALRPAIGKPSLAPNLPYPASVGGPFAGPRGNESEKVDDALETLMKLLAPENNQATVDASNGTPKKSAFDVMMQRDSEPPNAPSPQTKKSKAPTTCAPRPTPKSGGAAEEAAEPDLIDLLYPEPKPDGPCSTEKATPPSPTALICTCLQPADGIKMKIVACGSPACAIGWYHVRCLDSPQRRAAKRNLKWICDVCKVAKHFEEKGVGNLFGTRTTDFKAPWSAREIVSAMPVIGGEMPTMNPYGLAKVVEVEGHVAPVDEGGEGSDEGGVGMGAMPELGYAESKPYWVARAYDPLASQEYEASFAADYGYDGEYSGEDANVGEYGHEADSGSQDEEEEENEVAEE